MIPVAIFTRVSTKSQDYSRQISALQSLAEKNGYTVIATLTAKENDSKNSTETRAVQELKLLAEKGKIRKVLTTEVSRLGRNPLENIKLLETLHAHHVSILSQDMDIETLTPEGNPSVVGRLLHTIFSSIYEYDFMKHSARIHSGLDEARKKGKRLGRPKGTNKTGKDILQAYPGVVSDIKAGVAVIKIAKIHSVDAKTVRKVKKAVIT